MAEESEGGLIWDSYEYEVAEGYVSGIMNGDTSGLEDDDEEYLIKFEMNAHNRAVRDGWKVGHWSCGSEEDDRYAECDISGLFALVVPLTLHVYKEAV